MEATDTPNQGRRRTATAPDTVRASLTPEQWIAAATELLVDGGVDLVRVDVIAKQLQVTRGSFYWHFRDRDDLLVRMLETWRRAATDDLIERIDRAGDPRERLRELLTLPFRGRAAERAARIELALRDWARRDPLARRAVDEVDERRIDHIGRCFAALGLDAAQSRARAFIFYGYQLAEALLRHQGSEDNKRERSALLERLLTQ